MIGQLNHVAIAVPNLETAVLRYREVLGAKVSPPREEPAHGVRIVFVELPNTKIELMEPLGENSSIAKFLDRNPAGGIHHICYEVKDIRSSARRLREAGLRILGSSEPAVGAHGNPVLFLHPKEFDGALIELEEAQ